MNRHEYEERFCKVCHKYFGGSRPIRVIEGSKNLDQLRALIKPFMMRVRKDEVFKDLPAIIWDQIPVPLDRPTCRARRRACSNRAVNQDLRQPRRSREPRRPDRRRWRPWAAPST